MSDLLQGAEAIAEEIVSRLVSRQTANGAETDLGLKVYRGRRSIDDSMMPCAVLIEADDEIIDHTDARAGRAAPEVAIKQHYVIYAYLRCDADNPNTVAHAGIRDMKRAMFKTDGLPDSSFGRKVKRVRYMGRDISPRADGSTTVIAAIEITVEFVEDLSNP